MKKLNGASHGGGRPKIKKEDKEKQLKIIIEWVNDRLRENFVPRAADVVNYARSVGFLTLPRQAIIQELRLHPAYEFTSKQQRQRGRSRQERSIIVNSIGNLHGDVALYPLSKYYSTPKSYKTGYLICVDILTRQVFATPLNGPKDAKHFIKAFIRIFNSFSEKNGGARVRSLGFDKETAVMGTQVQDWLRNNNISFHPFEFTSSKSKRAEGGIGLMRREIETLSNSRPTTPWWNLLQVAANSLNEKQIYFNGKPLVQPDDKKTPFTPNSINQDNYKYFIEALNKAGTDAYFDQFDVRRESVKFKFKIGDFVRVKLIVISSKAIGEKRSERALSDAVFKIVEQKAVKARKKGTIINQYVCKKVPGGQIETFGEHDLALIRRRNHEEKFD